MMIRMPKFSRRSSINLLTCHKDIQTLFNEVIKTIDCTVIYGFRGKEKQNLLFHAGKSRLRYPNSKHNRSPSYAADVAPYPVDWDNLDRFRDFAKHVFSVAKRLKEEEKISHGFVWGGDWKSFPDFAHWELK